MGIQPGYWRTWMTGVRWHSSHRARPAVSNTNNSTGDILKLILTITGIGEVHLGKLISHHTV